MFFDSLWLVENSEYGIGNCSSTTPYFIQIADWAIGFKIHHKSSCLMSIEMKCYTHLWWTKTSSKFDTVHRLTVVPNGWNPPKISSRIVTSFSMQVSANLHNFRFRLPALHIQNLSNFCRHKYDPSISRFFFKLVFGGFFVIWLNCETWWWNHSRFMYSRAYTWWCGVVCDGSQRTVKDPTPVQSFYMGGHSNLAEALILARTPKLLHSALQHQSVVHRGLTVLSNG